MKLIYFLVLTVLIFLAGCTKQESTATAGLVIEKFTPQVSTVASNSRVEFTLIAKNLGEREATDVKAVLGGLTFLPLGITNQIEQQKYWKFGDENILKDLDPNSLLGADVESGFKGDQGIITWRLTGPTQTRDQTYETTVNLVYGYSTVSTILIKAVDFNYLQSLPESEQKSISTGVTVSKTTKGPIEISVKTDQAIISGFSTLPIEIEFKNVGGGRTFIGGTGKETNADELYEAIVGDQERNILSSLNKILVELPKDIQKCNLNPRSDGRYEVRLIEGKNGRILCHKVIGGISTIQTLSMDIKAQYRYLIEGKTTVKVSKTLYEPPIVDISLEDSKVAIEHDHSTQTNIATLDLKIKNVGNQPITGTDIKINYNIAGKSDYRKILLSTDKLESFQTASGTVIEAISALTPEVSYTLETDPAKLLKSDKILVAETNEENNRKSETIPLDYDIAVADLKAEVDDVSKLSVKIKANIKNNGENVNGNNIPITVILDDKNDDISCKVEGTQISSNNNEIVIDKLEKGADKNVVCIYENPDKKLSLKIVASVSRSELDKVLDNNFNNKPNGNDAFEINYDVAIPDTPVVQFVNLDPIDSTKAVFDISVNVVNRGTLPANDVTVKFLDQSLNSLCRTEPGQISLRSLETGQVRCTTKSVTIGTTGKAKVEGLLSERDKSNNEKEFTLSIIYDLSIVQGSVTSTPRITGDTVKYTLSAQARNEGSVLAENAKVEFIDAIGNLLCEVPITSFNLRPSEVLTKSCESISLSVAQTVEATARVVPTPLDSDTTDNERAFTILPQVSLGTVIISPQANSWQGTDRITIQVKDIGTTSCSVSVKDENVVTADKKSRDCSLDGTKNVIINLKTTCSTGELCCSVQGEGKCQVTLFSSDGKQVFTASRKFNIDLKPPTITTPLNIKDRPAVDSNPNRIESRIVEIELAAIDESTSKVRNTASGISGCNFTEQVTIQNSGDRTITVKGVDIPPNENRQITINEIKKQCSSRFLELVAYTDNDVFNYWKTGFNSIVYTRITVEVNDSAGNKATSTKEISVSAPPEVISIDNVSSGTKSGDCGGLRIENDQLVTPACTFNRVVVQAVRNQQGEITGGKIPLSFKTDNPAICQIGDSISSTTGRISNSIVTCGTAPRSQLPFVSFSSVGYSFSCDIPITFPTREVPQPVSNLYIGECQNQFQVVREKPYKIAVTLKDILLPLTRILSVAETTIPPVIVTASAASGSAPLNDVVITADVSGTVIGDIEYKLDCTNDGTFEQTITRSSDPYTFTTKCNYASAGTYTVGVTATRGGVTDSGTTTITASSSPGITPTPTPPPKVTLASSQTAVIRISGDEAMTCRWYEGETKQSYSDTLGQSCDGARTTSATCNTFPSGGFFARNSQYSMCVTCKDNENNGQTATETQCTTFKVKDFP